jgi:RNA polymerase-interacting CarD/CdnL/TRCF family regulator
VKGPPARHEEPKEQYPAVEGIITDASELEPGDRVVYPNQGVCSVTGVEKKEIAGQKLELVRMEREEDGAAVLVPKAKVPTIGLRKVASSRQIEGVFHYLAAQYDDPELDWKVRHRDNADRLIAGGVLGVAEVVKGLHALSRIRPLPTKEREQYDNARHLLVHEIAVSLAVPPALAEDYIDYALMPPTGVTFKLKPPPKPVELPARPRRKVVRTDDEDLGLDDLGIELGELPAAGADAPLEAGALGADEAALPGIPTADEIPAPDLEAAELPGAEEVEAAGEPVEAAEPGEPDEDEAEGEDEEPESPPRRGVAARKAPPAPARAEKAARPAASAGRREPARAAPRKAKKAPVKAAPKKAAPKARKPAPRKPARGSKKK